MSDELNVWRDAYRAWLGAGISDLDQAAAAVIHDYGDKRYQQAIADVVEWLRQSARIRHDWEWAEDLIKADMFREAAQEITRRFGKGQDHG